MITISRGRRSQIPNKGGVKEKGTVGSGKFGEIDSWEIAGALISNHFQQWCSTIVTYMSPYYLIGTCIDIT